MPRGIRAAILFTSIVLNATILSAQNVTVSDVAGNLICQCGCSNMVLRSCLCGTADKMKNEIGEMINNGVTEQEIYVRYIEQYGQTVMAAPPKEGFYNLAWYTPPIGILSVGFVIVFALRKWSMKNKNDFTQEDNEGDITEDEIERNEEYYEKKLDEELSDFI